MLRSAVSRTALKATGQSGLGGSSSHADGMHPNLGLHNAAATGNIGLVKFALENGQPANSNLNGILPLHAACSGGSEQSVRMLIFHGADVNAPRLKAKGSSAGPGAEGSTPLHFAAANGHLEILRILLEAGARPAAADKEGLVPEALALGNGHNECANLIRSWISAYGSNGLAGMVQSRDTVSGDVTLGPAGYIRYASPLSPASTSRNNQSSSTHLTTPSSALSNKSSSETLSAANPSKAAGLRSGSTSKGASIFKTSSNPNLCNEAAAAAAATPPLPVASPASLSASQSQSSTAAYPSAISPRLGAFPSSGPSYDSSDYAATSSTSNARSTSTSVSAAVPGNSGNASVTGSVRESKRRPSLPSILEKAAHPAASLRAALASGSSSNQISGSMSQASSSRYLDHSFDGTSTTSPGKKHSKLAGKRSLSNILRKATGNTPSSGHSSTFTPSMYGSSSSFFADASAASSSSMLNRGIINLDALAKPGRTSGKSFDYQRPTAASSQRKGLRSNTATASESSSEDPDAWKTNTAPWHQTAFLPPPLPSSRSDAAALEQQRKLRSASSSSSLSAARDHFLPDGQVQRARAGSNEQIRGSSRMPTRGNVSLDLLRPTYFGQSDDVMAARKSAERYRAGTNQNSRIDAMKRAGMAQATGSETSIQRTRESPANTLSTGRDRSVSGSSSRSAGTTDNDASRAESTRSEAADDDDLQEFLHHTGSDAGDRTLDGGERHNSHRLPAGLRSMTALRQQNTRDRGDSSATEIGVAASSASGTFNEVGSRPSAGLSNRVTRDRSGSHVSAISSGSQSGNSARGVGSASIESGSRNSPRLNASYQALSIAEENGLPSRAGHVAGTGSSSSVSTRAGRAPSITDSLASHASSSSLRSNYLTAAEQAQAILNHETPYASDGPDGTSASLAAQLAAYGEALAQERKRAGDARTGPSPSLSARGSNAALRSKLPSVSEDQSPSRSAAAAGHGSRSYSVSENRAPNYPATAAQSYNRRVSRRPHSSEGRQSQDGAKRGLLGSGNMTIGHSTLSASDRAKMGLDRSPGVGDVTQTQGQVQGQGGASVQSLFPAESERLASPGLTGARVLGSPMHIQSAQAWAGAGEHSQETSEAQSHRVPSASGNRLADSGSDVGPMVPPKDQPRRRLNPVTLSSAVGVPVSLSGRRDQEVAELDDEDEDDPKTPVLGGNKAVLDKFAPSPHSLHRHSPSMPTELSSYTAARRERSPGRPLADSGASSTTSLTPPVPPPRKESINVPALGTLGLDDPVAPHMSVDSRMLTPDSAMWSSWRNAGGGEDEINREKAAGSTSSSRWEGLRRPSLNMLRSATSSSTQSQTPSQHSQGGGTDDNHGHSRWSTDDTMGGQSGDQSKHSPQSQQQSGGSGSGKRRLVRNLLNKAKGSS